jgi:hypothetical protein
MKGGAGFLSRISFPILNILIPVSFILSRSKSFPRIRFYGCPGVRKLYFCTAASPGYPCRNTVAALFRKLFNLLILTANFPEPEDCLSGYRIYCVGCGFIRGSAGICFATGDSLVIHLMLKRNHGSCGLYESVCEKPASALIFALRAAFMLRCESRLMAVYMKVLLQRRTACVSAVYFHASL